jgi:hypothetical protein
MPATPAAGDVKRIDFVGQRQIALKSLAPAVILKVFEQRRGRALRAMDKEAKKIAWDDPIHDPHRQIQELRRVDRIDDRADRFTHANLHPAASTMVSGARWNGQQPRRLKVSAQKRGSPRKMLI